MRKKAFAVTESHAKTIKQQKREYDKVRILNRGLPQLPVQQKKYTQNCTGVVTNNSSAQLEIILGLRSG